MPAVAEPPNARPPVSGSAVPPSSGEIHVTPPAAGTEGNPAIQPPKPGSARARMQDELRKKAGMEPVTPAKPPAAIAPAAPPPEKPTDPPKPGTAPADPNAPTDPATPPDPAKPATTPAPGTDPKAGKPSPWKLFDQMKDRATKAEARVMELEKQMLPPEKRKELDDKLQAYEKRITEMTDDLRYFNAEKYDPEILKVNEEYERAWKHAVSDLSEVPVIDSTNGQQRTMTSEDILAIVNLPLAKARDIAQAAFGDFADDVMAHRKEIRKLFDAKSEKLDELKKNGAQREKDREEQRKRAIGSMETAIKSDWEKEHTAAQANEKYGKYFKSREGDDEWNTRLERGFAFVEKTYGSNVYDPNLSAAERTEAVKRHVALRNRAAAFDPMRFEIDRLTQQLAEAKAALQEYQDTEPPISGQVPAGGGTPAAGSARDRMLGELRKLAK